MTPIQTPGIAKVDCVEFGDEGSCDNVSYLARINSEPGNADQKRTFTWHISFFLKRQGETGV